MSSLTIQNLKKSYAADGKPHKVLSGINLEIADGEFVAIVGCSGSGKTTLVSLIAGLIEPDEGEILVGGKAVSSPGTDRGVIFQNYSLLPWLSAYDNIYLAVDAAHAGLTDGEKKDIVDHWLGIVGLTAAAEKKPGQLSGGMRQRVAVARGLAMNPGILLLDEPFSALDALTRAVLQKELGDLWMREKKTILMVTNDIDEAILLADRICPIVREGGGLLAESIPVPLKRPRTMNHLSLDPDYQRLRKSVTGCLSRDRALGSPAAKAQSATLSLLDKSTSSLPEAT